jgi:hypothetical protein
MKLKLDSKWKFIARTINGSVMLYTNKPSAKTSTVSCDENGYWIAKDDSGTIHWGQGATSIFESFHDGDWKDSLHEILEDGTLRKVVDRPKYPIDTKVLVRDTEEAKWNRRHFAGWDEYGWILCWVCGRTSHTETEENRWKYWKLYEGDDR